MKSVNTNLISLGTTYYNNPESILEFVDQHKNAVDELIIVDDGSDIDKHIYNYVRPSEKIRLFRVLKDYGFNSHGCRNLIMKHSSNDFVILLDSDRIILDAVETVSRLKKMKLRKRLLYRFVAMTGDFNNIHPSVNDFMIHRDHFFSAGGYDEELMGFRNGDRQYFEQLLHYGGEKLLHDVNMRLVREASILTGNSSYISHNDKKTISKETSDLIERRVRRPDPDKPILTFEWEELT